MILFRKTILIVLILLQISSGCLQKSYEDSKRKSIIHQLEQLDEVKEYFNDFGEGVNIGFNVRELNIDPKLFAFPDSIESIQLISYKMDSFAVKKETIVDDLPSNRYSPFYLYFSEINENVIYGELIWNSGYNHTYDEDSFRYMGSALVFLFFFDHTNSIQEFHLATVNYN